MRFGEFFDGFGDCCCFAGRGSAEQRFTDCLRERFDFFYDGDSERWDGDGELSVVFQFVQFQQWGDEFGEFEWGSDGDVHSAFDFDGGDDILLLRCFVHGDGLRFDEFFDGFGDCCGFAECGSAEQRFTDCLRERFDFLADGDSEWWDRNRELSVVFQLV